MYASRPPKRTTYCNPLDLDYGFCPIPDFTEGGRHRATADPALAVFEGAFFLFGTNQAGYWWSEDRDRWTFVPREFLLPGAGVYDELCAPAVWVMDGALHVLGSTYTTEFAVWRSRNPREDDWEIACPAFPVPAWDPAFFLDDDGRLYLVHGSSHDRPIRGVEIHPTTFAQIGEEAVLLEPATGEHGWERFGEVCDGTFLPAFREGPWLTKRSGRYYLEYGAPATEFSGYADGVYVSDAPLGPYVYQPHNPVSYVPGGFARGAGHGATFAAPDGRWWHVSTQVIAVKNNFERRIGMWPTVFEPDGTMRHDCAYSDLPRRLCDGAPAGWMLLNAFRPVRASSTLGGFAPNLAVDESVRTYWSALTGGPEWLESDLGDVREVRAVQIIFADQDASLLGKHPGLVHDYRLLASRDGAEWFPLAESEGRDAPHAYHELPAPVEARFVRLEVVSVPTGRVAVSGLRVFGLGQGPLPGPVTGLTALRGASEPRNAWLRWHASPDATGYVVRSGLAPDALWHAMTVYGPPEAWWRAMTGSRGYWFTVEAFNESGVGPASAPVLAPSPEAGRG